MNSLSLLVSTRQQAEDCHACPLSLSRQKVVFGEGSPHARLMFVGEGPGSDEDRTGRLFMGRAGEILSHMIQAMGLSREDVYITNAVKCRPPGNRFPSPGELNACFSFLFEQIYLISPQYMILLGQTATQIFLKKNEGISRLRGQATYLPGFPNIRIMPTYHPSYLLRNPAAKKDVWADLKTVMGWMELSHRDGRII